MPVSGQGKGAARAQRGPEGPTRKAAWVLMRKKFNQTPGRSGLCPRLLGGGHRRAGDVLSPVSCFSGALGHAASARPPEGLRTEVGHAESENLLSGGEMQPLEAHKP